MPTTIPELAKAMQDGFISLEKRLNDHGEILEKLAGATAVGFADMEEQFKDVYTHIEAVRQDLKGDIRRIDIRLSRQQDVIDDNKRGVRRLEQKVGLTPAA